MPSVACPVHGYECRIYILGEERIMESTTLIWRDGTICRAMEGEVRWHARMNMTDRASLNGLLRALFHRAAK